ncbi:allantoicase [Opitutia bacterium ISCC 51]|nr:allantoicase [Opitutae bacterium ISCC 51]QXD29091.1 allantoicase [Opitutae bacterium ISCC 52]
MQNHFLSNRVNLASAKFGAEAIYATDDFFADKSRMLLDSKPVFIEDKYDENGKWMDGWESRRKRGPGYDYCIVRLAFPGNIDGFLINTAHFSGNFPPEASVDACTCPEGDPDEATEWTKVLAKTGLKGNSELRYEVPDDHIYTHVRLNIFPDGGIARFHVFGTVHCLWDTLDPNAEYDLLSLANGGRPVDWNDAHFGHPVNMLGQGRGVNMGDGWETARRREPGNDWCVLQLGHPGIIDRIVVDTAHFKGNYPDRCSIQAAYVPDAPDAQVVDESVDWAVLMPESKLSAHAIHEFSKEVEAVGKISHVRLNIFPDGGISRLRLFGKFIKA